MADQANQAILILTLLAMLSLRVVDLTGHNITHGFITLTFEYGMNFSERG